MYDLTEYTINQAKKMGVLVAPSKNPKFKIDIYNLKGEYLTSGGAVGYLDYPHYLEQNGKAYADERRRLYYIRHKKEIENENSRGYLIAKLLW